MAGFSSIFHSKKLIVFLNISFTSLLAFFLITSISHTKFELQGKNLIIGAQHKNISCRIHEYEDYKSKCLYLKSHNSSACTSKGYINYLQIFYCTCGQSSLLGHSILLLWLAVLFYLLGNTAAEYFCSSLESLSTLLKLSPTIAGVTLLSLGNGAPDVFSSIVSFTRSGNGDVGLNSVLGGAFVVSNVVVGVISTIISSHEVSIDKSSFIRDVCFFIFSLASLFLILVVGAITLWVAILFLSIYFLYVCVVLFMQFHSRKKQNSNVTSKPSTLDSLEMGFPLLVSAEVDQESNFSPKPSCPLQHHQESSKLCTNLSITKLLHLLELPLYLPRRLTIPVVDDPKWSKPFAVASVSLSPTLMTALFNTQRQKRFGSGGSLASYLASGLVGFALGNLAYVSTNSSSPPKKWLLPWLAGGFLMSVTWTYIIAEELVSLLVSMGYILGIDPSVLGLTLLAWGNSLGDLITNVAMAVNGGPDGAQIAISGCYAGPMFNTLLGLGVSFVISAWDSYPSSYVIPGDGSLYETLGFLVAGLVWALVVLPWKGMKLDRVLGVGLLFIYLFFLVVRLCRALGGL